MADRSGSAANAGDGLSPDDVAAYLRRHPSFLAEREDLYRHMAPPLRVHGDAMADHMAAMLRAERRHAAQMSERADGVLAAGRASAGLAARVQEAVLALIHVADPVACITDALPALLAIDAASLCIEAPLAGARQLPPGTVARLLGGRAALIRDGGADAVLLHGEAARLAAREALVRVPGEAPALLALVARDAHALDPSHGTGALMFLGRAVAIALGR